MPLPPVIHPPPVLTVEAAIERFLSALSRPCRILVALSGGSDSTGLVVALNDALSRFAGSSHSLFAVTVDHDLRPGSAEEAQAAARFCHALAIPHCIETWRGDKPASGLMAAARDARYALIARAAEAVAADLVVTGHTLDDQAETLAMQAARSAASGPGIPPAMLFSRRIWVLRPLLSCRRAAIRAYLAERGFGWIDDPSNDNPAYERVRVRQALAGALPAAAPADRGSLACAAAAWLEHHVRVEESLLGLIDNSGLDAPVEILAYGLSRLLAVFGGRRHLPSQSSMEQVLALAARDTRTTRLTVSGTLIERGRTGLSLCREIRGVDGLQLAPGEAGLWDGRFLLRNGGESTVEVGAAGGVAMGSLRKRARAAAPRLTTGAGQEAPAAPEAIAIAPAFALFDRFLPIADLAFAARLAHLFGAAPYPAPPLRLSDGKTDEDLGFSWQAAPATLC